MRTRTALWICALLATAGIARRAETHGSHVVAPLRAPKQKKQIVAPARIVLCAGEMGELAEALRKLGHQVDVATKPADLETLLRAKTYDVAVVPLASAHALLVDLRLRMVVPVVGESDDRAIAEDFTFNIPRNPAQLKDQIEELNRALALLPRKS